MNFKKLLYDKEIRFLLLLFSTYFILALVNFITPAYCVFLYFSSIPFVISYFLTKKFLKSSNLIKFIFFIQLALLLELPFTYGLHLLLNVPYNFNIFTYIEIIIVIIQFLISLFSIKKTNLRLYIILPITHLYYVYISCISFLPTLSYLNMNHDKSSVTCTIVQVLCKLLIRLLIIALTFIIYAKRVKIKTQRQYLYEDYEGIPSKSKKYLKPLLNIILYGGIYYFNQFIVTYGFIFSYSLNNLSRNYTVNELNSYIYNNFNMILFISIIISFIFYFIIFKTKDETLIKYSNFRKISMKNIWLSSLVGITFCFIVVIILTYMGNGFNIPSHDMIPLNDSVKSISPKHSLNVSALLTANNFFISILSFGLIVPIFEEILFRGLVFTELKNNINIYAAVFIQALLFAIYHGNVHQASYTFFLGLIAGITCLWTYSLWSSIIIHVIFNSINVIIAHFSPKIIVYVVLSKLSIIPLTIILFFSIYLIIISNKKSETSQSIASNL